jgi:formylglycine-generating enzyme required for sulfatase activity
VQDWYYNFYEGTVTDPTGPATGTYRVIRGGSWCDFARCCRSAYRVYETPYYSYSYIGFRLAKD